jgi:phosphoglycolate phosphatase
MVEEFRWDVVLFDLDGTIIDPFDGIAEGLRKAFTEVGEPAPADESIRSWIGPPMGETLEAELGHRGTDTVAAALATFRNSYDNGGAQSATLHSGMSDLIIELQEAGTYVAIVTMKPRHVTDQLLEQHDLRRSLDGVFAPLSGQRVPSKADLVADALVDARALRATERGGVVVGDRAEDMRAARVNDLAGIGVAWGFGAADELLQESPVQIVTSPLELATVLREGEV